jgi:hypothetical protein
MMRNFAGRSCHVGVGVLLMSAVLAGLSACGGGGGYGSSGGGMYTTAVMLDADSGAKRAADGTWISCYLNPSNVPTRDVWVISRNYITVSNYAVASAATYPCTGGSFDATNSGTLMISTAADVVMGGGWVNGQGTVSAAPNKASGVGTLAAMPTASMLMTSGTVGTRALSKLAVFVDDSMAPYRFYTGTTAGCAPDMSGNPQCLVSVNPYYLQ